MAPSKAGRKKRAIAAPQVASLSSAQDNAQATSVGSARQASLDSRFPPLTLSQAVAYYGKLTSDSTRANFRLDGLLWVHGAVGAWIVSVVTREETPRKEQELIVLWAALWLGRRFLLVHFLRLHSWKSLMMGRLIVMIALVGAAMALNISVSGRIDKESSVLIGVMVTFDAISAWMSGHELELPLTALRVADAILAMDIFMTQFNNDPYLIVDHRMRLLLGITTGIQYIVVDGIKSALFKTRWPDNAEELAQPRRQKDILDDLRRSLSTAANSKKTSGTEKESLLKEGGDGTSGQGISGAINRLWATPSGQVSLWMGVQAVCVLLQVVCAWFFVYAWEYSSFALAPSVFLLTEIMRVQSELTTPLSLHTSVESFIKSRG